MHITRVSFERLDLVLNEPYTIAYETVHAAANFILKLETNTGLVGWGCAAPDPVVTHETPQMVETIIRDFLESYLPGKDPFTFARIQAELKQELGNRSSARAMVDMALYDLVAQRAEVPLYRYLGGYRQSIPTSITIGILPLDDTLRQAEVFVQQGFTIIKLKGGLEVEGDIEKIRKLRERYPALILRFDGNQGYTKKESVHFSRAVKDLRVEIFEQPLPVEDEGALGEVTSSVALPVMADESLKSLKDVFRLTSQARVDMINIKLMKVGGILEGLHINSVAKSAGVEVMVGCIDECALGIAAGLHFALSRPNIEFADLDGHLDFKSDPFSNLFHLKKGILYPLDRPGLGVQD